MPELPDLEAYTKNLSKVFLNKEVSGVVVDKPGKLNVSKKYLIQAIQSSMLTGIRRNGKEVIFEFSTNHNIGVHLMIEGKFDITNDSDNIPFRMFVIEFGNSSLVISDPRGWAKMEIDSEPPTAPDALSDEFTVEYLKNKLNEKKTKNIKAFLIDQDIIRGIGNAYVDEILWEAKISPESKAGRLPEENAERLFNAIKIVLTRSVDEILKSNPDIVNGEIRDFMRVHRKDRETCPNGHPIMSKKIASKTTYYTEEQEVY